ncbi:GGDEF domain-containing protein [Modicisalibacter luteus]|uniref:GGDEF domain-containing protein n=1 Tax=Modicisalibacter luteus TaxID=453962 RepID=UPI00363A3369
MVVNEIDFFRRVERDIIFAFQPIVSMHSGRCYAVEALMRNWDALGFRSIGALLDFAHQHRILAETDLTLRKIALRQFHRLPHHSGLRLFFNLDNRLLASPSYNPQHTLTLLKEFQLPPSALVLEVSERNQVERGAGARSILQTYQDSTLQIAIDDFGTGYAGLSLLYDMSPDYLKIDRYFIADIDKDPKKKIFVSHVVSLAKTLGIKVIAEGVETAKEFYICREIGCDLAQGYLIQHPERDMAALKVTYELVADLVNQDRRAVRLDWQMLQRDLDPAPVLRMGMPMVDVLEAFRCHAKRSYFPLLNNNYEPLGIVHENELKGYIFSPYGRALLVRKTIDDCLKEFRRRCAVTEITTPIETVLEQYTANQNREGIIVTQEGRYVGVLSADAMLRVMQDRNLQQARDQSPLTRLPGNTAIEQFIAKGLQPNAEFMSLVYFDLDNFKAFNDNYGFRRGIAYCSSAPT